MVLILFAYFFGGFTSFRTYVLFLQCRCLLIYVCDLCSGISDTSFIRFVMRFVLLAVCIWRAFPRTNICSHCFACRLYVCVQYFAPVIYQ